MKYINIYYHLSFLGTGLQPIADIVRSHIEAVGSVIVQDACENINSTNGNNSNLINLLLEELNRYASINDECFSNSYIFQKALKDAFSVFCNQPVTIKNHPTTTAELMSNYVDGVMRNVDKLSDADSEIALGRLVDLFSYLHDKDQFAMFHRIQLSRRLLVATAYKEELGLSIILNEFL